MRKKSKNNKLNKNQTSFYFEDHFETIKKNKFSQRKNFYHDRIYLLFFLFFSLILIFSIRIVHVSLNKIEIFDREYSQNKFTLHRRDIIDRNGTLLSRNVKLYHAAINPKLIKNKENFLIKLRLNFPEIKIDRIEKKINEGKYFYLKKELVTMIKKNYGV